MEVVAMSMSRLAVEKTGQQQQLVPIPFCNLCDLSKV